MGAVVRGRGRLLLLRTLLYCTDLGTYSAGARIPLCQQFALVPSMSSIFGGINNVPLLVQVRIPRCHGVPMFSSVMVFCEILHDPLVVPLVCG
jgi:hypothetical protein